MKSLLLILRKPAYFAPAWVFSSINILVGTWILYIPQIKHKFLLNDAELGLALFFNALGLLSGIPLVPLINKKIGPGRSTKIGILLLCVAFNLPLLASSYWFLCASLFLIGVFSGFTDVSMNALISIIESRDKENLMSAAHGFFSLGGFIGAGVGSVYLFYFSEPRIHMLIITGVVILVNVGLAKHYDYIKEVKENKSKNQNISFLKTIRPVIGLSIIAFIVMFNEGAVEHWSNLYLFEVVGVPQSQAGLGFVLFSLSMTLGRFLGDELSQKIGSIRTLSYGCLIAVFSYGLILYTHAYTSTIGFGGLGFGLSVVVPEVFRLAGKNKTISASVAISTVSGIGFVGFMIGPVLLGIIANSASLLHSYIALLFSVALAWGIVFLFLNMKYKMDLK